jgi:2',3'-cyclic-nucleotide 2'-phosphodiesterase
MRILFIGDIVARPGRNTVRENLPGIIKKEKIDLVIANAENLAHGRGATTETLREMQDAGVNFFTGGDHLFWHKGFENEIDELPIIRPANYPESMPGKGSDVIEIDGKKILIINLMGQTFINETLNIPFQTVDEILRTYRDSDVDIKLVDIHAEATSEKLALAYYLDGRVNAVVGTHTHVPTCDERVLPNGTLFVSDIGMTGNIDTVLGVKKEIIIDRMAFSRKQRFEWGIEGRTEFRSVLIDTDKNEIRRIDKRMY